MQPAEPLFYFELFVKSSGNPQEPGTITIGVAEAEQSEGVLADGASLEREAEPARTRYIHYHSSGRRMSSFPRSSARMGRSYGVSFGSGDTVGCGWLANGDIFFTCASACARAAEPLVTVFLAPTTLGS
jgi:hypothetical protein